MCGCGVSALLIHDIQVVEDGIQRLNPWHLHANPLCEFDRRAQIRLHLHWALGSVILIHDTIRIRLPQHFAYCLLLEIRWKGTILRLCKGKEFIEDVRDQLLDSDLLDQC